MPQGKSACRKEPQRCGAWDSMEQITYQEITSYLLSIPKFTTKHTMEDTCGFYRYMGSPCAESRIIHVAGTNGKGSVCTYLRSILEQCGHHTALFVSPHLISVRERFLFDGSMVSEESFCTAFFTVADKLCAYENGHAAGTEGVQAEQDAAKVQDVPDNGHVPGAGCPPSAESMDRIFAKLRGLSYHPSFFEMLFFMFLECRETAQADYVILETGLGGRLDATNCMPRKELCVITRIALDHTEYLGKTTGEIAREKAGIFRELTPAVCLLSDEESAEAERICAGKLQAPVEFVDSRDFKIDEITNKSIAFSYQSVYDDSISFLLSTTACYQAENAALAVRAVEVLAGHEKKAAVQTIRVPNEESAYRVADKPARFEYPSVDKLRKGIYAAQWEGRMEEVLPDVFLDGAHNEDGMRALLTTVKRTGSGLHNVLILAIVADKRYERMAEMIAQSGLFFRVYVTSAGGERALAPEVLAEVLERSGQAHCTIWKQPEQAFSQCLRERRADERVYAAGSLYLIGRIKAYLGRNSDD